MSKRPVEHHHETAALPLSIMAQTAMVRVALVAVAVIALWAAITWAVALP